MNPRDAAAPGRETGGEVHIMAGEPSTSLPEQGDGHADGSPADAKPERPRCVRCGHPLALPRSVARAYGAKCWRRTAVAQLHARRDTLGRVLGRVARRVAVLDADGLAIVTTALGDVLASLDATGLTV